MAIIKTSSGAIMRQQVGQVVLTSGGQGQQVGLTPTTNRQRAAKARVGSVLQPASPKKAQARVNAGSFQTLDQAITALDAQYELAADKPAWAAYAADIAGSWQLCANCEVALAAKKLYRQANLYALVLSLPPSPVYPPGTGYQPGTDDMAFGYVDSGLGAAYAIPLWPVDDSAGVVIQLGSALANPAYIIYEGDWGSPVTSGPLFDWIYSMVTTYLADPGAGASSSLNTTACTCTIYTEPGMQCNARLVWSRL
jgi:hypothetical protein